MPLATRHGVDGRGIAVARVNRMMIVRQGHSVPIYEGLARKLQLRI
jgi:hypothetical protein